MIDISKNAYKDINQELKLRKTIKNKNAGIIPFNKLNQELYINHNKFNNKKFFLIIFIIISILINGILNQNVTEINERRLEDEDITEVVIVVSSSGEQEILYENFNNMDISVYIDGEPKTVIGTNKIDVPENKNTISIRWSSQLTYCEKMFSHLSNIIEIDFSNFNTSQVTSMKCMFEYCTNLKKINFGNKFSTSKTDNMYYMFFDCTSLTSLDLSVFDTSSVYDMSCMFYSCTSLEYLNLTSFNTSITRKFIKTFFNCNSLKSLDLSSFNTELVDDMTQMFTGCNSLSYLDISSFNTKLVTKMDSIFKNCYSLTSLNLSGFDTSLVNNMQSFFEGCSNLSSIDISKFNTSSCTNMKSMFRNCLLITSLDLSNFDTSNVENMENMFSGCESLISLDLHNFNTTKITTFSKMFNSCSSLITLNISNFDTSQVINYMNMFYNCKSLSSLDLSSFNTNTAETFEKMFYNCFELISLELSNFDTSNVNNMNKMFYNCRKLTSLNLSNFNTLLVENMISMFEGCSKLKYINIQNFNENIPPDTTNMFKGTPDDIIYCIRNIDLTPNIINQLIEKSCEIKDCDILWKENYNNLIEIKKSDINVINDKCIIKDIESISEQFYYSNKIENVSIYSYEIDSASELKAKNINLTFIEFSEEEKKDLLNKFGINITKKIYIFIYDAPSNNSRTATSNFIFVLENGTKLNLSELKEDFFVTVTIPIRNLDLANFNYAKEFSLQGYDIYNKTSEFYNDVCSPAYTNNNDIILKDRRKDIYPNNVTLCKENCEYKGINLEEERIVCQCNLYQNKDNESISDEDNNDDFLEEEEDGNFLDYILDNLNYKIIKCYHLLLSFDNFIKNPAFYAFLVIFIIIMICSFKFIIVRIQNIRISMFKEIPTKENIRKLTMKELTKIKENLKQFYMKEDKFNPPKNRMKNNNNSYKNIEIQKIKSKTHIIKNKNNDDISKNESIISETMKTGFIKKPKKNIVYQNINIRKNNNKDKKYKNKTEIKKFVDNKKDTININDKKNTKFEEDFDIYKRSSSTNTHKENIKIEDLYTYNLSPYTKALREDKRNIFQIFKSFILEKFELLNIFRSETNFREILVSQYIISLLH